jgi:hypothetical protein
MIWAVNLRRFVIAMFDVRQNILFSRGHFVTKLRRLPPQHQRLPDQIDRPFRVGAVFAGSGAAARVMGDFNQREFGQTKKLRFRPRQFHEDRLAQRHRRFSFLL